MNLIAFPQTFNCCHTKILFVWQSLSDSLSLALKINAFKNVFVISCYHRLRLTFNKKYNLKKSSSVACSTLILIVFIFTLTSIKFGINHLNSIWVLGYSFTNCEIIRGNILSLVLRRKKKLFIQVGVRSTKRCELGVGRYSLDFIQSCRNTSSRDLKRVVIKKVKA